MRIPILALLALWPIASYSYSVQTHQTLSEHAFLQSTIPYADWGMDPSSSFPNSVNASQSIQLLIVRGVVAEDDLEPQKRPVNHFYDPVADAKGKYAGLTVCGSQSFSLSSSPDWIISGVGQQGQEFSYSQTRKSML